MKWTLSVLMLVPAVTMARSEGPRIVFVGHIRKIDIKTRMITIAEKVFPEHSGRRGMPVPISLEGTAAAPGGFEDFPPGPIRRGGIETETKVSYSTDTSVKSMDKPLDVKDLKVGDAVRITGRTANKDIVATEIQILPHLTPKNKHKP